MFAISTKTTIEKVRDRRMGFLVTYRVLGVPVFQHFISTGALNNGMK